MHDLNDMRYFAEVVDHGSFAGAARALDLPTSRLSRRIARLEAELGVRLLHRTTRKLSLTAAGEQYHRHCVAVRDQADQAQAELARILAEPRGPLRVSCPVTLAQTTIGPLIPGYLARHPKVRLDMQVSNRVVDLAEEGVDLALRVRPTLEDSGSAIIKQFGLSHGLLVASPALLRRHGRPAQPAELERFDAVGMSAAGGKVRVRLLGPQGARHEAACRPACIADDLLTLRFVILGGVGIGVLPDYMCHEDIAEGRLERLLPGWSLASGIVHAAYLSRRGMSPALRSFLDYLGEKLVQDPGGDLLGISPLGQPPGAAAGAPTRPAATPSPPPARPGRASARGGR
ncbi:LysR substrate-binding domain-containing protein [Castellaniella defragrans]|uniref:DNA-binding transcriptional LysR family regulator n=1 Tax=Castellaniella defragrans TaxID=75697 RepID=A0A7W9TKZ2_CASDE|nr:LysR substrate-binding domain-containing protein [Castellaniella defragrans]KAB0624127.1 LysR family transcriptional regulator [Castellaniella defragrans]MBB6082615.1 DNA-binding transcriptional LysR family regulator [Castellaniella defragrans]